VAPVVGIQRAAEPERQGGQLDQRHTEQRGNE
jgi:hypothetical protein